MLTRRPTLAFVGLLLLVACGETTPPVAPGYVRGTVTAPQLGALAVQVRVTATPSGDIDSALTDAVTGGYGPLTVAAGNAAVSIPVLVLAGCAVPAPVPPAIITPGDTVMVDVVVDCSGALIFGHVDSPTLGPLGGVDISAAAPGGTFTTVTDRGGDFTYLLIPNAGGAPFSVTFSTSGGLPGSCTPAGNTMTLAPSTPATVYLTVTCS